MARGRAVRIAVVGVLSLAVLAVGPGSAASGVLNAKPCKGADCGVVGDPHDAAYVGNGGLLLPVFSFTGSAQDRSDAATCGACRWALLPMCRGEGHGGDVQCGPAAESCPPGQYRRIVLLLRPGDTDWQEVGLVCLVDGAPTTVDDVATQLKEVVVEDVPPLAPSYQPKGGTLIGLPAVFAANQPEHLGERQFELVGFAIVLRGKATWNWDFGDGSGFETVDPGGEFPDMSVAHTYGQGGTYEVTATSTWQAWFTVDGMGPWPVSGPAVTQTSDPLELPVLPARAGLVVG